MNKAVIMAGGFGTRLRPLTMNIPKPMVPVMNLPMMEHIVYLLKHHNITDITSVLYFQPDVITEYFKKGLDFGVNMSYVKAVADYGTAGAVRNAAEHLKERFIVISGDVLTDFDLTDALNFHIEKKSMATLLLTRVEKPLQYGIVMTDNEGKITRFLEKPSWGQVFSDTINTGIYILEPEVLDLIPYREEFDFSQDLFPLLLNNNMPLFGYIAEGYWRDIGNLNEYQESQIDCLNDNVKLYYKEYKQISDLYNENIDSSTIFLGNNDIDSGAIIGHNSVITNSIIGKNSKIGNGVKLNGAVIWDNVTIGDFAELNFDVVCSNCTIGDKAFISENVFIADHCKIGNNAKINPNLKLWPNKTVEEGATLSITLVQEERWQKELFSGARITGVSNIEINPDFGAKLGAAIGMTLGKNATVVASRDSHEVSRIVKRSLTSGICSVGVNVYDLQEIPIPQTRMELQSQKFDLGVHVRRSQRFHNYSDIIIFSKDGRDIPISATKKIERFFFGEDIKRVNYNEIGHIVYSDRTIEIYRNKYLDTLDIEKIQERNFRLLIDYSYGVASTIFPSVLGSLNVKALSLNNYIDPSKFHPDPSEMSVEDDQSGKIMTSLGYQLGFSILPGAEKISLIDERGVWYSQTRMLTLLTKLFLETNRNSDPYKIAVSIAAPRILDDIAKEYGVEVTRIKNNHSAMMDIAVDKSYRFIGGIYGGYIFNDFLFASDAMYSIGKILEMLAKTKLTISQIDDSIPQHYQILKHVKVPWYKKGMIMRKLMEYSENYSRELIEGVKILIDDISSVLLMPDQEKGAFVIISESNSNEKSHDLANEYVDLINKWKEEK